MGGLRAVLLYSPIFIAPLVVGQKLIRHKRAQESHVIWLAGVIMVALGAMAGMIWLFLFIIVLIAGRW